jgi:hypothetical protein
MIRGEERLRMLENSELKTIFEPRRGEITD